MTYPVEHIGISIDRPPEEVYRFAADPKNMRLWVQFISSISPHDEIWIARTDLGQLRIKWTPPNRFGILDHVVTPPDNSRVNNPLRVIPNNEGSELIFSLIHRPGRTAEEYREDREAVLNDLHRIKYMLENETSTET